MAIGLGNPTFSFTALGVTLNAPSASGVYAICDDGGGYIYFGESNDIRRRLTEHLNDRTHSMHRNGAASFAFDLVADNLERVIRQNELIRVHQPRCNQMLG